jgi:hypothetical protein
MTRYLPTAMAALALTLFACKKAPPAATLADPGPSSGAPKNAPIVPGFAGGQITTAITPSAPATDTPHNVAAVDDAPKFYESIGTSEPEVTSIAVTQTAPPVVLTFTTSVAIQPVQANNITGSMWDITGNFMSGFLWGVAVAAHQVEGYNTNNDWWSFETFCNGFWEPINTCFPKFIRDSGRATDHFSLFADSDLDKARDLGSNTFRMSIEWSRIEPSNGVYSVTAM